jgi:4'-phosphopantetheinyl transferase
MRETKVNIKQVAIKKGTVALEESFTLEANAIIVYSIYLPNFTNIKSDLGSYLDKAESERAARFHKERDRDSFLITRSLLKIILASYTKLVVTAIHLDYQVNKKPYLSSHPWLHFNVSHSEDYAVIAISREKVGIDIEFKSDDFDHGIISSDIFENKELTFIKNASNKSNAFYTLWTRKEALVKALGKGIDENFKYIPCLEGQYNLESDLVKNSENWQLSSFEITDNYAGALAYESSSIAATAITLITMPNTMEAILKII